MEWLLARELSGQPYEVPLEKPLIEQAGNLSFASLCIHLTRHFEIEQFVVAVTNDGQIHQNHEQNAIADILTFLDYRGEHRLYIAEVALYERRKITDFYNCLNRERPEVKAALSEWNEKQLANLEELVCVPRFLQSKIKNLSILNMWINREPMYSDWHYDLYENYIAVLKGRKVVNLLPRECFGALMLNHLVAETLNIRQELRDKMLTYELTPGKILKIPTGWVHCVTSDPETVAINFWFENYLQANPKLAPSLISQFVQDETVNNWTQNLGFITSPKYQKRNSQPKSVIQLKRWKITQEKLDWISAVDDTTPERPIIKTEKRIVKMTPTNRKFTKRDQKALEKLLLKDKQKTVNNYLII